MDANIKLLLLKIIKFNGDISPLLKLQYDYSQVARLIQQEISDGNAEYQKGNLFLTAKGNLIIEEFEKARKGGGEQWIEPEIASKIMPIAKDFIYLPSKKELSFKRDPGLPGSVG
jgi:hypothetical protein